MLTGSQVWSIGSSPLLIGRPVCQWVRQWSWNLFDMIVNVVIVKRSLKKKWSLTRAPVMSVIRKIQYEKQFPIISIIFENGNENCHEMRNVMLEVLGNTWEVREGREGEGWLLITDIQNISTKHKAGKVVVKTWFNVFITLSPHQAREASSSYSPGYFSRNQISFRFLTANKVRELQRMVPPVSAEL